MKTKIKIIKGVTYGINNKAVDFAEGELYEVDESTAASMVKDGYAEKCCKQNKKEQEENKKEQEKDKEAIVEKNKAVQKVKRNKSIKPKKENS